MCTPRVKSSSTHLTLGPMLNFITNPKGFNLIFRVSDLVRVFFRVGPNWDFPTFKGFKCFLLESGVMEFPCVTLDQAKEALFELKDTKGVLLFHAELDIPPALTVFFFLYQRSVIFRSKFYCPHLNQKPNEIIVWFLP